MARVPRKTQTSKSEHWLRVAVNERTTVFDEKVRAVFGWDDSDSIEWVSPLPSDQYSEYHDQAFLERMSLFSLRLPLSSFWPARGPQWDGLARSRSGKYILVEAKAYPNEAKTSCAATSLRSLKQIKASLEEARRYFGGNNRAAWLELYYQYANRLAHIYYLRELNGIDAYLLLVNFADAPDVIGAPTEADWLGAEAVMRSRLGLAGADLHSTVASIIWSVPRMQAGLA